MVDPFTVSAIAGAVGGATQALVQSVWRTGEKWITGYYQDHRPAAEEAATRNGLMFLSDLAQRVQLLENATEDDSRVRQVFASALDDPDFAGTLQAALLGASRTKSREKHGVLASIVADRLILNAEDFRAVLGSTAAGIVPRLTTRQIRMLGLFTLVQHGKPGVYPNTKDAYEVRHWYNDWLNSHYMPLYPYPRLDSEEWRYLDVLDCVVPIERHITLDLLGNFDTSELWDLRESISRSSLKGPDWIALTSMRAFMRFLSAPFMRSDMGIELDRIWKNDLMKKSLTPLGKLIGAHVHDYLMGWAEKVSWDIDLLRHQDAIPDG
jgi:hypothetical protein